jgi:hypothetical protein
MSDTPNDKIPEPDKSEPLIDLAAVYPHWDGFLHPRWVTKEEMRKLFPEEKSHPGDDTEGVQ